MSELYGKMETGEENRRPEKIEENDNNEFDEEFDKLINEDDSSSFESGENDALGIDDTESTQNNTEDDTESISSTDDYIDNELEDFEDSLEDDEELNEGSKPPVEKIKSELKGGLEAHEAKGGHLLEKHVGQTEPELLERLNKDPKISGSSSFYDKETAEYACYKVLSNNKDKIEKWLADTDSTKLTLRYEGSESEPLGIGIQKGENSAEQRFVAKVVLKKDNEGGYYILTGFPDKKKEK